MVPGELVAGRFVLGSAPLGRGAAGEVWPATEQLSGDRVVLRLPPPRVTSELRASWERLAKLGVQLKHPAWVRSRGLWSHEGSWVLAQEQVREVLPLVDLTTPLPVDQCLRLAGELADALSELHALGEVHGDVRPARVWVGRRKVRLAWSLGAPEPDPWAPPEVQAGNAPTAAADVYGLGQVLRWALGAGRAGPPRLPFAVQHLLDRMTEADPTLRPVQLSRIAARLRWLARFPWWPSLYREQGLRLRPRWSVIGQDPEEGRAVLVRTGLDRRAARRLVQHLRQQGWGAQAHPDALGPRDLAGGAVAALAGGVIVPVFGALPALLWYLDRQRRRVRTTPHLSLVPYQAPLPARHVAPGAEWAVSLGLLLLSSAALLGLGPWPWALLPLAGALLLALAWSRVRPVDPLERLSARQDRVRELAEQLRPEAALDGALVAVGSSVLSRPHLDERLRTTLAALREGPDGPSASP